MRRDGVASGDFNGGRVDNVRSMGHAVRNT